MEDTYGAGVTESVMGMNAGESVEVPHGSGFGFALTWPLYQVRALQYSSKESLPLISDDPLSIPPLPNHPNPGVDVKGLAQQLAIQAVSLALPYFRSVDPARVSEFRFEVQPLAREFRSEMVKMTAELAAAIAGGASDGDLRQACEHIARTKVLPALNDLSRQIQEPIKPWKDVVMNLGEAGLTVYGSIEQPLIGVAWALISGTRIASDYIRLYRDRQGALKSGLSYLLQVQKFLASNEQEISDWDKRDWRCSGYVQIAEPGQPLTPESQRFPEAIGDSEYLTTRHLYQTYTESNVLFLGGKPPAEPLPGTRQD